MSRTALAKKVCRVAEALVIAGVIVVGSTSCGAGGGAHTSGYCAIFADSTGLYVGNPVTQMGYQVGAVDMISPSPSSVRVDFSLTYNRPFPKGVKAVIRSASILADRSLELVGNYESGPKLEPGQCVPQSRSATPKSLSEVIGSANTFINGINSKNSSNIGDVVSQLDQAAHNNGAGVNEILTTASRLLDNPDASISDLGSIVGNVAMVTRTLVQLRDPMKEILNDAPTTFPMLDNALFYGGELIATIGPLLGLISDLEVHAGDELQLTLDAVSDVLRINTPHAPGWVSVLGGILKPLPWWINRAANHFNNPDAPHWFHLFYRPPLYRIRTPDGPLVCAIMNSSMPGSCANVAGQPYGVDINLLQYVFMNASS